MKILNTCIRANQKACYSTNIGMEKSIRFTRRYRIENN